MGWPSRWPPTSAPDGPIEADRAKPRSTARWVTVITVSVLGLLALSGTYIEPYGSGTGQVILATLLAAYVATLAWMRSMAGGAPLPRILGPSAVGYRPRDPREAGGQPR